MAVATLTSKGQVTIPREIRDSLRLRTGDKIEFVVEVPGQALLRPITRRAGDVYGLLHEPGRRVVTIADMDAAVRSRFGGSPE